MLIVLHLMYHWSQAWVKHFHRYIKETAKNKINVIIHEPIKATGVRRTYPNMMTREGVAGEEQELINQPDPGIPHQSRLIFQRGLGGPTDYTPGIVKIWRDYECKTISDDEHYLFAIGNGRRYKVPL